jgi:cold shock CspA family protein
MGGVERRETVAGDPMQIGKIIKLVHLSQQSHPPGTRLGPGHHDLGYGILQNDDGSEVYFSQTIVAGLHGFDDLRRGQQLEYTLDDPFLRAASVRSVAAVSPELLCLTT